MSDESLRREYRAIGYGKDRVEAFKDFYREAKLLTGKNIVDVCLVPGSDLYLPPVGDKLGEFRANFTLLPTELTKGPKKKRMERAPDRHVDKLVDEIINGK